MTPPRPLAGLVVLERGDDLALRHAGRLLAALGARVLRPDGPGPTEIGYGGAAGAAYAAWLDADKETGTPAAPDLVLIEADEAPAPAPDGPLVAVLRPFAPGGPYAGWTATDAVIQALAGHVHPFGPAEGPPAVAQGETPRLVAGVTLCLGALAGLLGRRAGAGPARVETDLFEAMLCLAETVPMVHRGGGPAPGRRGVNRFFPTFPGACWQAADGWIGVTALTPPQWRGLCALCGRPDLAEDPALSTSEGRTAEADAIEAALAPRIRERPVAWWVAEGQARRVPIVAALRPGALPEDPHWRARGAFAPLGETGLAAPRLPFRLIPGRPAARPARLSPTPAAPLRGLRVLDFSMGWSGPLATRHLAGLGAEVIKVESRARPDWWRGWNGVAAGDPPPTEMRREWAGMNLGKRGVLLDLTEAEDRETARRLLADCDVMIENFATGVIDKLGFGHAAAQEIAPGLVSVSMALFGAEGPDAGHRGYGSTTEQASGLAFVNGAADWPPVQSHVALGDPIAGLFAAVAALAGVWAQGRDGGLRVDLSQVETLFQIAAPAILAEQATGRPVPRDAAARPGSRLTRVVPAAGADEWLLVDCESEAQRAALAAALGVPTGAAPEALDIGAAPEALDAALRAHASARPAAEAAAGLQAAGVPAAPVTPPHLLDRDPHLLATGVWRWIERPHTGAHLVAHLPLRLDGARLGIARPAPVMGQDDELLTPFRSARATA